MSDKTKEQLEKIENEEIESEKRVSIMDFIKPSEDFIKEYGEDYKFSDLEVEDDDDEDDEYYFSEKQLEQIKLGRDYGMEKYKNPEFSWMQLEQIRLGLKDKVNVEEYANKYVPWREMRKARLLEVMKRSPLYDQEMFDRFEDDDPLFVRYMVDDDGFHGGWEIYYNDELISSPGIAESMGTYIVRRLEYSDCMTRSVEWYSEQSGSIYDKWIEENREWITTMFENAGVTVTDELLLDLYGKIQECDFIEQY